MEIEKMTIGELRRHAVKWEKIKQAFWSDRDAITDRFNYFRRCCVFTEKMRALVQGTNYVDFIIFDGDEDSPCPWCNSKPVFHQDRSNTVMLDFFICDSCKKLIIVDDAGVVINRV